MCFSVCANRRNYNKRSRSPATASTIQPAILEAISTARRWEKRREAALQTSASAGGLRRMRRALPVHDTVGSGTKWFSLAGIDDT
jgi:hypothetical protein